MGMQSYSGGGFESCAYYYRYTYLAQGSVKSIGYRTKTNVIKPIDVQYGNISIGDFWTEKNENEQQLIQDAVGLRELFDNISKIYTQNGWFIGKLDFKTKHGDADLISGHNIKIFELSQSITTDIPDKRVPFFKGMYRAIVAELYIGFVNLLMGNVNVWQVMQSPYYYVQRYFICN